MYKECKVCSSAFRQLGQGLTWSFLALGWKVFLHLELPVSREWKVFCISAIRTGSHLELSSIGVEGVLAPGASSV